MIVKMIKNLENKMEKMQESINKDQEELKNKHTGTNNTITEIKNTLEGINSRISEAEKQINKQTNKNSAQISPYMKLTQTTGQTLGGQKPKEKKYSTLKPGKRRPQTQ